MKWEFFQAITVSIIVNVCTTMAQIKQLKKKLDVNYTKIQHAFLDKSSK